MAKPSMMAKNGGEEEPPGVNNPDRLILDNGTCSSCHDDDACSSAVCCFHCNKNFHALCKDTAGNFLPNNICTRSFINTFASRAAQSNRFGNFWFRCNSCATSYEHQMAGDTRTHVKSLENKIVNLESDITEIKDILLNKSNSQSPSQIASSNVIQSQEQQNIWDDVERVKKIRTKVKSVINGGDASKTIVSESDLKTIAREHAIHVDRSYVNDAGETVVVFPTQNDREKLNNKLKESFPDSRVQQIGELLPTISIANISTKVTPQQLTEAVLSYHPEINSYVDSGGVFKVLGNEIRKQNKNELFQANVRVSNNIRKFIENNEDRVYVGFGERCKVYDHFHVKRCNNCQKFNHFKDKCEKSNSSTCAHCSGNHASETCQNSTKPGFIPTCFNCKSNNHPDTNHKASDTSCPMYKEAQNKLRNSIMYYSKNI